MPKPNVENQKISRPEKVQYKILHLNVQCMRNKLEQLEICLVEKDPDVVCICEHW